jgi:hypothetical protein
MPEASRAPSPTLPRYAGEGAGGAILPLPHGGGGLGRGHDCPAKTQSLKAETP